MRADLVRRLLLVEVALILIEAIIGMFVNLYVIVPFPLNFNAFAYSSQGAAFGAHHYVAALVLAFAVLAVVFSFRIKYPLLAKISILGLALLIVCYGGGTLFVFLQPNNFYSLIMAAAGVSALVVYTSAVFLLRDRQPPRL